MKPLNPMNDTDAPESSGSISVLGPGRVNGGQVKYLRDREILLILALLPGKCWTVAQFIKELGELFLKKSPSKSNINYNLTKDPIYSLLRPPVKIDGKRDHLYQLKHPIDCDLWTEATDKPTDLERRIAEEGLCGFDSKSICQSQLQILLAQIPAGVEKAKVAESERTLSDSNAAATNLVGPFPRLHGRDRELQQISSMMLKNNRVNLFGQPGLGKLTLAREYGRISLEQTQSVEFVTWVDFLGIERREFCARIGQAIELRRRVTNVKDLIEELSRNPRLLIMTNLDGVEDIASEFVTKTQHLRRLRLIFTSARPIAEEIGLQVFGLEYPSSSSLSLDALRSLPSVSLLEEVVQKEFKEYQVSDKDKLDVSRVCRHYQGVPASLIAIASYATQIMIATNRDFIGDRAHTLTECPQAMSTILGRIGHSGERCAERLCIFQGGFTYEAAKAILADQATLDDDFVKLMKRGVLEKAVDRYHLSKFAVTYFGDELRKRGYENKVCRSFCDYYTKEASIYHDLNDPREIERNIAYFTLEYENVNRAIELSMERGGKEDKWFAADDEELLTLFRAGRALANYLDINKDRMTSIGVLESLQRLVQALKDTRSAELHNAFALFLCSFARLQTDVDQGTAYFLYSTARDLRQLGSEADARISLGLAETYQPSPSTAESSKEGELYSYKFGRVVEAQSAVRRSSRPLLKIEIKVQEELGHLCTEVNKFVEARQHFQEALRLANEYGWDYESAINVVNCAVADNEHQSRLRAGERNYAYVIEQYEQAIPLLAKRGRRGDMASVEHNIALAYFESGRRLYEMGSTLSIAGAVAPAVPHIENSLDISWDLGSFADSAVRIETLGDLFVAFGVPEKAELMYGAAAKCREVHHIKRPDADACRHSAILKWAKQIGREDNDAEYARGYEMRSADALLHALEEARALKSAIGQSSSTESD